MSKLFGKDLCAGGGPQLKIWVIEFLVLRMRASIRGLIKSVWRENG